MSTSDAVRILIVDDKLALADTLADGLADRGYSARAEGSAHRALDLIRSGAVDVVVTDLRMPDVDGLALLEAARATADIPVIVMTAYGAVDSAVESIRKGAYHYLTKPFKLDELLVFVERALAERALRRELAALRDAAGKQLANGASWFCGDVIAMRELQRQYARWALDKLGGFKARAAERLDIDIKTLNRLIATEDDT